MNQESLSQIIFYFFTHRILHRDENNKNYLKVDLYKNSVFDSDLRFSPSL